MPEIVKTWPSFFHPRKVRQIFGNVAEWDRFFFTLGRGKPSKPVGRLWFTHRERIIGSVHVERLMQFDGFNIPPLRRLDGEPSNWQIRPGNRVAICPPPFEWLKERIYMSSFRGWRWFDLQAHRKTTDAKVRI